MNELFSQPSRVLIISLVILGFLALAFSGVFSTLSSFVNTPLVGAQSWFSRQYQAARDFVTAPRDVTVIRQEIAVLEAENARLQAEIVDLQQQLIEFEILSALLEFARSHPEHQYLGASVIGRDPSPFLNYILINRGSDDGLRRGMPVVTHNGLAGRITQVTPSGARVQLITDPTTSINVKVQPSGAEAILSGSITGDISLQQIPQDADIRSGNLILTSGLGGNFPANIIIGQITSVRRQENALFQSASVQPVTDYEELDIVLVITNFNPIDTGPLVPTPGTP